MGIPSMTNPLRIGIDFHVVDGKFQGSRTHVIELFAQAILLAPEVQFYLFLDRPEALQKIHPAFGQPNVHAVRMPASNPLKRLYSLLPKLCKQYAIDIVHTQYILPWPVPAACLRVVTVHDVLFETHPQFFTRLFVLRSRFFIRLAARQAAHVFTVSDFCKREIVRLYRVPQAQVSVIHNGADLQRFQAGVQGLELVTARGLKSRGYILSVGRLEPRKNHQSLVEAYAQLPHDAPPLVLVGQRDFHFAGVFDAIARHGLKDRVHILENVSDAELPALYRHAQIFAYPAFAEGFGMPPLEAMASGTPVVTSQTTAIPEVVESAGILVDPYRIDTLVAALKKLLSSPEECARLGSQGQARAAQFSWQLSAQAMLAVYRKLKPD
jgi:glycosyltransferase involved in cell wall biosynthesis